MTQVEDGTGCSPRPSASAKRKRRRARRAGKRTAVDVATLIDTLFDKKITIREGGVQKRITGFGAILQMMWIKEMSGDHQALAARKKYEAFAREQRQADPREIIVKGGLPERTPDAGR